MEKQGEKLFLVDAMALIYRAYFALNKNPRINSKGLNTSAILGFANSLYDVIKNEKPTYMAVAFDSHAPTIRHTDFADYKAQRQETPEDIIKSVPYIERLVRAFNIPVLVMDGYEADDNIFIYKPGRMGDKFEILGIKDINEKYGINNPSQVIDILGLWGDASDNIPGVPGIGEVRAKQLIAEYGSIENLLSNTDKLTGKIKENLKNYSKQAIMSKQLATIILDVPIEFDEKKFLLTEPDFPALKALLDELEFRNFAKRVFTDYSLKRENSANPSSTLTQINLFDNIETDETSNKISENIFKTINDTPHNYYLIDTFEKRKELIAVLLQYDSICFDTETTGLDTSKCELAGISFCVKAGEAYFVSIPSNYNSACNILNEFKEIFTSNKILKIGQNIKFDISVLKWYDIDVCEPLFDTMIAHYLLQPDNRHNMDYLARVYLNYKTVAIEELIGKKGKLQGNIRDVDIEILKEYAAEDADITFQLKNIFDKLLKENNLTELFYKIEMPLVKVLSAMENEGVKLDMEALREFSVQLQNEISILEKKIYELAGEIFNIASSKQLGTILFEKLKISDKTKLTKTKQLSTNEEVLRKLINKHPIVNLVLEYRSLTKLKSTYADALPTLVNPRTGRIHTSYNQAVAATGRLSSNNPNLQNIPVRTETGKEIRKAFIARNERYILISADYSQIELRIMASLSGDKAMQESFIQNLDIHAATAAKVYNVPLEMVTPEMRQKAKTVNFGIIYGISAFGLSERLLIPRSESANIIEQYFKQYPGVKEYMNNIIKFAREHGYVQTILGRRRYLRDINSANASVRGFAERNAINTPIQGSAADMIKIAMNNIYYEMNKLNFKSKMIMQVHDELVFDAYKDEVEVLIPIIKDKMVNALPLNVPIETVIKTGNNWLEAH